MNISLGTRLRDGRRVGIEWRRRRTAEGTVIRATLRHDGELSPEDLERCLAEIVDGERMIAGVSRPSRRKATA